MSSLMSKSVTVVFSFLSFLCIVSEWVPLILAVKIGGYLACSSSISPRAEASWLYSGQCVTVVVSSWESCEAGRKG